MHYNKKILDLLDEERVSGESSGSEKVSRSLKYDSKMFLVHIIIDGHQHRSLYSACTAHAG